MLTHSQLRGASSIYVVSICRIVPGLGTFRSFYSNDVRFAVISACLQVSSGADLTFTYILPAHQVT